MNGLSAAYLLLYAHAPLNESEYHRWVDHVKPGAVLTIAVRVLGTQHIHGRPVFPYPGSVGMNTLTWATLLVVRASTRRGAVCSEDPRSREKGLHYCCWLVPEKNIFVGDKILMFFFQVSAYLSCIIRYYCSNNTAKKKKKKTIARLPTLGDCYSWRIPGHSQRGLWYFGGGKNCLPLS